MGNLKLFITLTYRLLGIKQVWIFLFQIKFECLLSHKSHCWSNLILAFFSVWINWTDFGHQHGRFLILFWATNMLDVTSSEKVASHYIYIFFYFSWCLVKYSMKMKPSSKDSFQLCWHQRFVIVYKYVLLKVFQCSCRAANNFFLLKGHISY